MCCLRERSGGLVSLAAGNRATSTQSFLNCVDYNIMPAAYHLQSQTGILFECHII